MNNSAAARIVTCLILIALIWCSDVKAQSMNVRIDIDPELLTAVEQNLDFGQIVTGSGIQSIPLGSPSMGVFRVRAMHSQAITFSVDTDPALQHTDQQIPAEIPTGLRASYTNGNQNNFLYSRELSDSTETIVLTPSEENPGVNWTELFIYVYGDIYPSNVPPGNYLGSVTLTVIYP
jgi:hypothetical protein